ncbi:MAG: protein kinase [Acidobacteria bacterium]|nr:protein kinase [Acidobacteriota bacterium]
MSPTITTPPMTQAGIILGTAAYMAPEQARGKTVDKRADIWAFGAVLFEMLSGQRAFEGDDVTDVLASVLAREPAWAALPANASAPLRALLRRCLEKDRRKRVGDIAAALFAIEEYPSLGGSPPPPAAPLARRPVWQWVAAMALGALAGVVIGALARTANPPAPLLVTRSRFVLADGQRFTGASHQLVSLSPDGTQMVYAANNALFLRSLSDLEGRLIDGTGSGEGPFPTANPVFSPDGRSIAYWSDGELRKIAIGGGTAVSLCKAEQPWGIAWSEDGIVYGQGPTGILRISANGGMPEQLVTLEGDEVAAEPQILPGGEAVLFTLAMANTGSERWDAARIVAQVLESGRRTTLVEGGSHARYLSSGHIVYAVAGTLFAAPFDGRSLEVTGSATPVLAGVARSTSLFLDTGSAHYSLSETGSLAFVPGPVSASGARELVRIDRQGGVRRLPLPPNAYGSLRISPDGGRVAFDTDDRAGANVWTYDLSDASQPQRLTFGGSNRFPIWSADGQRVVFQSDREDDRGLWWQRADGTGAAERLTKPEQNTAHVPDSWSNDGERFLFSALTTDTSASLWTFSLADKKAEPFGDVRSTSPLNAEFSPDGRWVAYTLRTLSGANVYVEPFPATGAKYQITTVNGHHPLWLPGGTGLSYRVGTSEQVVVGVSTMPSFSFGNPTDAAAEGLPQTLGVSARNYDLTRDGEAFLAVAPVVENQADGAQTPEIQIVQNWVEELKRLVPANRAVSTRLRQPDSEFTVATPST